MNDFRPCRPAIFYKHWSLHRYTFFFKIIFKKCIMYLLFSKRNKGTNNDNHSIRLGGKTIWLRLLFRQKSRPKKKKWGEKKSSHNEEEKKKDTSDTPASTSTSRSQPLITFLNNLDQQENNLLLSPSLSLSLSVSRRREERRGEERRRGREQATPSFPPPQRSRLLLHQLQARLLSYIVVGGGEGEVGLRVLLLAVQAVDGEAEDLLRWRQTLVGAAFLLRHGDQPALRLEREGRVAARRDRGEGPGGEREGPGLERAKGLGLERAKPSMQRLLMWDDVNYTKNFNRRKNAHGLPWLSLVCFIA